MVERSRCVASRSPECLRYNILLFQQIKEQSPKTNLEVSVPPARAFSFQFLDLQSALTSVVTV